MQPVEEDRLGPLIFEPFLHWRSISPLFCWGHYCDLIDLTYLYSHPRTRARSRITGRIRGALSIPFPLNTNPPQGAKTLRKTPGNMDLFSTPPRVCWWRILFLLSIFQNYMSSMLDCPPTCTCSTTDIFCNKSYQGNFLPLLALQDTVSDGNTTNSLPDLFENISSM